MYYFFVFAFVILLVSCSSTGPQPQLEPQAPVVMRDTVHRVDTLKITDSIFVRQTESFRALQKSIDSLIARKETQKAIDMLKQQVQYYNNLDQLGFRTLQLANLLYQSGHGAEALAILESFAVYKPAINFWIDSANTFYDRITDANKIEPVQQIDPAKQQVINSLTAQIRNMKITNANPVLITELADSLRFLAPGDSILSWLDKQVPSSTESSDSFCEEQRKFAAENFASSRRNRARAEALLTEAIEALDKCLARTPSADMRKKVVQNRDVLMKELKTRK
ncbi:MAG: hypothetical protein LBC85_10120 [Fibromonadaceae bacterium]|jgi:tetratricopeptide (TPR) repeat protein|nr:hypothetical protein [Fibromonadaceae bacterium]